MAKKNADYPTKCPLCGKFTKAQWSGISCVCGWWFCYIMKGLLNIER